jgi:hypothetical protein
MASLKEIFEKAQQTGKVEYTFFGGGNNVTPFNQTSIPFTEGNNKTLSSNPPYIRLGYEGSFPGDQQFRTNDPTNTYNTLLASTRDTARIGAFLTDYPNGPLWLAKQSVLQLTNPDTSYKTAEGRVTLGDKLSQITGPRFYNPIGTNTLAQVASNALGLHFTRHGLSPTNDTGYLSINTTIPGGIDFQSRLTLYKTKLEGFNGNGNLILNNYQAGPDSTYLVGNTQTNAYKDSFGLNTGETDKGAFFGQEDQQQYNKFIPFGYDLINTYSDRVRRGVESRTVNEDLLPENPDIETNRNSVPILTTTQDFVLPGNGKIQDFRKVKNMPQAENYPEFNIHNRIGVTTGQNAIGTPNTVDSINVLTITPRSVFYGNSNKATNPTQGVDSNLIYKGLYSKEEVQDKTSGKYGRDIIRFRIELLNNDRPLFGEGTSRSINTDVLAFRAYLGDFSDDITPTWKSFNYMGRGEDFFVYEKFSRSINFSFFLFAHSKYEMPAIYTKLNYLMSSMAPDYNDRNQMRGTYAYLTIGSYIYQQPGVFTKMSISNLLDAPWETTLGEPENRGTGGVDTKQHDVPKYMKVSMGFNPIHNFLPRKNKRDKEHTATFITPNFKIGHSNYYLPQGTDNRPPLIDVPEKDIPV